MMRYLVLIISLLCPFLSIAKNKTLYTVQNKYSNIYKNPARNSEILTQVLYSDVVKIIKTKKKWAYVKILYQPDYKTNKWNNYQGWINKKTILKIPKKYHNHYLSDKKIVAINSEKGLLIPIYTQKNNKFLFYDLTYEGTIFPIINRDQKLTRIILPNGRIGIIQTSNTRILMKKQNIFPKLIIHHIYKYIGAKYLWGGLTKQGIDCSGLIYISARASGTIIPRDTNPQFLMLEKISGKNLKKGDLIFYHSENKKISHVALYIGKNYMLHASGKKVQICKIKSKNLAGFRRIPKK